MTLKVPSIETGEKFLGISNYDERRTTLKKKETLKEERKSRKEISAFHWDY